MSSDTLRKARDLLAEALEDMIAMAQHGAAYDHLSDAGVMQDPPHRGKYAECEAPWCVRSQRRLAAARAVLDKTKGRLTDE